MSVGSEFLIFGASSVPLWVRNLIWRRLCEVCEAAARRLKASNVVSETAEQAGCGQIPVIRSIFLDAVENAQSRSLASGGLITGDSAKKKKKCLMAVLERGGSEVRWFTERDGVEEKKFLEGLNPWMLSELRYKSKTSTLRHEFSADGWKAPRIPWSFVSLFLCFFNIIIVLSNIYYYYY